ncbi:MAG: DNA replication/repair protein RecF [Candidatus Dormibacteraeota bacterium]|nr:DNA replication/repair protein RecF [Candidatus Dormibacteraeota bacterium]MBO0761195.1 DNA replication/repair protein RecF [Candidatus Dormibacteraeota bacterium]
MRLLSLSLRNYRNYARLDLEPAAGLNVFLGANGQGKTNLLESVAMLALSSSPRARREAELLGPVAPQARIEGHVESGGRTRDVHITISGQTAPAPDQLARAHRRIEIDGQPRRAVDLPGLFRVSLFWPDDLSLAKSGPEHRRRLLNHLLVQIESGYARTLSRYARVVEQRNSLLRQVAAREQPASALEVWDQEMARLGEEMARARGAVVAELAEPAAEAHAEIAGGERLELEYAGPPDDLLGALQAALQEDLRRGSSSVGPHRDDVVIRLEGRETRGFASQGQQRTAVVSIKLAEAAVVGARTGEPPVLLLDDVLSELDGARREALLGRLAGAGQVIVTSVEADPFPEEVIGRAAVRRISAGQVVACG